MSTGAEPTQTWWQPHWNGLREHACPENAAAMAAYMKHVAPFMGVKTPLRRTLLREHLHTQGNPKVSELAALSRAAFAQSYREMHYGAVDLCVRYKKKLSHADLPWIEELIVTTSWWDTVDLLAAHVVGDILQRERRHVARWNQRWMHSDNLWLNRTALLYQLRWKGDTDTEVLFENIRRLATHQDFFIRKGIGWALRTYGDSNAKAVRAFVPTVKLSPLSVREALRKI